MRIELRLFASLRRKLPPGSPRGRCDLDLPAGSTLDDLLRHMDIPRASAQLVLVNGESGRDYHRRLSDGDVVSVFPQVAGG